MRRKIEKSFVFLFGALCGSIVYAQEEQDSIHAQQADNKMMIVAPMGDDLSRIDRLNKEILLSKKQLELLELQKKMNEFVGQRIEQSLSKESLNLQKSGDGKQKEQNTGEPPVVRSVSIIGENKEAILLFSDGYIIAKKGMVLPDGSTVEEITLDGVLTNKNGVRRTLVYGMTIPFPRY